jgi:hypothetical protein
MTAFTIAVREKGSARSYSYIGGDGKVHDTTHRCKPLTREEARLAKRLLVKGAKEAGRPVDCVVIPLLMARS